jgi:hypothetical protein
MVNSSKILTVSYGTFSCTLEGFDDSFDTMKAIAEYFRDLAADDRYFGAEPPTPDADMLAQIAEREIARRVDAHEKEGKIVLRAAEDTALTEPLKAAEPQEDARQAAPETSAPKETKTPVGEEDLHVEETAENQDTGAEESQRDAPLVQDTAEPAPVDAPAMAEIAESQSDDPISAAMADFTETDPVPGRDVAAEGVDSAPDTAMDAAPEAEPNPMAEAAPDPETEADHEPITDSETQETVKADPAPLAETVPGTSSEDAPQDDGDSVADRLRRIRSLVDGSDAEFQDAAYSEDEHAQDFLSETAAELDEVLSVDDAAEEAAEAQAPEPDSSSILDDVGDDASEEAEAPEVDETPEPEAQAPEVGETAEPEAQAPVGAEIAEDTLAQLLADAMPEREAQPEPEAQAPEAWGEPAPVDDTAEERPAIQARVVKMKRSEFEAAISDGYIEEDETHDDIADDLAGDDSGLSAEEEAELQRELAEVEAELTPPQEAPKATEPAAEAVDVAPLKLTEADQVHDEVEEAPEAAAEEDVQEGETEAQGPRGISKLQRAERQADLARIFDETDTQLDAPESNKRRSAIQHLRAAVAATRAENKAGAKLKEDVDDSPYRSDLASVVRPRRPEPGVARPRSSRPSATTNAQAPLQLVAEQRVDTASEPVRPRRVSATQTSEPEVATPMGTQSSSFNEFAKEMGVRGLPGLLEAAAAYLSDVEGRPQFSRPMLMGKLKEVKGREFSREDGLRSFGQLLRQGKLQKLKGGRFRVTDSTDYRAETRNVG